MSDIQTFKLKSCFRRELLKFKWAEHIEEENTRLHAHLRVWPSHLAPRAGSGFVFVNGLRRLRSASHGPHSSGVIISNVQGWIEFPLNLVSKPDKKAALSHNLKTPTIWSVRGRFFILHLSALKQRSGRPHMTSPMPAPWSLGCRADIPCCATTASSQKCYIKQRISHRLQRIFISAKKYGSGKLTDILFTRKESIFHLTLRILILCLMEIISHYHHLKFL